MQAIRPHRIPRVVAAHRRRWLLTLMLAAASSPMAVEASDRLSFDESDRDNPTIWKPRTKSVAVFKNGFGFFTGDAHVQLRDGWCASGAIPPAVFGTLALYADNPSQSVDVIGTGPGEVIEFDGLDAPRDVAAIRDRLGSSINLDIELTHVTGGDEHRVTGRLVSIGPEYAVLEGPNGHLGVRLNQIRRMQVLNLPMRVHVRDDNGIAPASATLGMAYMRRGIVWIPEYTLQIIDAETAELSLRGTLVNEAEDLIHADVHFVVGVPNILHDSYLTPVAVGQLVRGLGTALAPSQVMSQIMSRASIVQNTAASYDSEDATLRSIEFDSAEFDALVSGLPQQQSEGGSDYAVYTKNDLTIRRGEKAIVTLFKQRVRYGHLYRWSPPGDIRHYFSLRNESNAPWTTGACLAVSGAMPLSEDLLRYTPVGGTCELPVTTAINIAHSKREQEAGREFKAVSPSSNRYLDLVTLEGSLSIHNYEDRPVRIIVESALPGEPVDASDDGEMSLDTTNLQLTGRQGRIRWRIDLAAGASKELTYRYKRYVPTE